MKEVPLRALVSQDRVIVSGDDDLILVITAIIIITLQKLLDNTRFLRIIFMLFMDEPFNLDSCALLTLDVLHVHVYAHGG